MDITALGELLIDFTEAGDSAAGMRLFERNPGGAVANVACAGARLGLKTAFVGKVGGDMHGQFLKSALDAEGVDTTGLILDPGSLTTLAFVALGRDGENRYDFFRDASADLRLRPGEVPRALIARSKILHVGTLSLTAEPSRGATMRAVALAREAGAVVSCDVNYRAPLWRGAEAMLDQAGLLLPLVDMLKVSAYEAELLTGDADPAAAARALLERYDLAAVAVTRGEDGAYVLTPRGGAHIPAFRTAAIDTTGAGDTFWAAFLRAFLKSGAPLAALEPDAVTGFARFAAAAASLTVEKRGAIPALPALAAVQARLDGDAEPARR